MKIFKNLIIIFIISLVIYFLTRYIIERIIYPIKYKEIIVEASKESNLDPYLVFAVIKKESGFNSNIVSVKGAKGLMQLMDNTAKSIYKSNDRNYNIYDPKTNITIGTIYLKQLIDRYDGNLQLALCAYNAGLGNVDKWKNDTNIYKDNNLIIKNIPFNETKNYVISVLNYYNKYIEIYKRGK